VIRFALACLMAAIAIGGATSAAADPRDLLPYCSGNETPMDSACRAPDSEGYNHGDSAPGANPETPTGVNPDSEPVI
jgi:hypothetical protein